MIQYLYTEGRRDANVKVRLDGKIIGEIKREDGGWRYYPSGKKTGGELFTTLQQCQKSLAD